MIKAFHSNWTTPFFKMNPNKEYYIEDFEISNLSLEEIIYIDIYNYILTYHTINDKIDVTTTSLLDIEKQLINYGFFKINRSTIVNLKYIKSVKDTLVDVNGNI